MRKGLFSRARWTLPCAQVTECILSTALNSKAAQGADVTPHFMEGSLGLRNVASLARDHQVRGEQALNLTPGLTPQPVLPTSMHTACCPSGFLGSACLSSNGKCHPVGPLVSAV